MIKLKNKVRKISDNVKLIKKAVNTLEKKLKGSDK